MPYPTQHENFYKNRIVQLQQKLQQLTEIYNYRLNEVAPPRVLHSIPDADVPFGGTRFIPNGPNGNPRPYGVNRPTNVYTDPADLAAREAAREAAEAAAAAAAHAALVTRTMGTLMNDLKTLPFGSWGQVWEIFTDIEREAFIALFGSQTPVVLEGLVAGVPAQFIRYMTPNGEWGVMYNTAMPLPGGGSNGHPNWIPLIKGNTPFGQINSQGFLVTPTEVLNNNPGDIFVRPNPTSTTPGGKPSGGGGNVGGGGLGTQPGSPIQ